MENIYHETIKKVEDGARFTVNYETRSLKIDGKYIIKNGQYEGELLSPIDTISALSYIEALYNRYRHSIPSERSDNKRKTYFQPLSEHEMSDEDMLYGESRDVAQVSLELYVLCSILNGSLDWDKFAKGKWFWKSEKYPTLIILKQWIQPSISSTANATGSH